jgi:hypothetical protein
MADNDIPKQELLIKLLRMTESDNDGETLTAIRKANAFMRSAGWDWEKLVNAKIRIIEDPFKNLGVPQGGGMRNQKTPAPHPAQYANPQPAASPPPPPPPPPVSKTTWPLGIQPNRFSGWCYCCGFEVLTNAGVIFKPNQYHAQASADWKVACLKCNQSATVNAYAANRQRQTNSKGKPKPAVSDLS